jgi:hypothetical protein
MIRYDYVCCCGTRTQTKWSLRLNAFMLIVETFAISLIQFGKNILNSDCEFWDKEKKM